MVGRSSLRAWRAGAVAASKGAPRSVPAQLSHAPVPIYEELRRPCQSALLKDETALHTQQAFFQGVGCGCYGHGGGDCFCEACERDYVSLGAASKTAKLTSPQIFVLQMSLTTLFGRPCLFLDQAPIEAL